MTRVVFSIGFGVFLQTIWMSPVWASWCTETHLKFNNEYTKMDPEGRPFQIGTLDSTGHKIALVVEQVREQYQYLRDVKVDGLTFREFRSGSLIFQLGMPDKNGMMLYSKFTKDTRGTERGFAGVCSG